MAIDKTAFKTEAGKIAAALTAILSSDNNWYPHNPLKELFRWIDEQGDFRTFVADDAYVDQVYDKGLYPNKGNDLDSYEGPETVVAPKFDIQVVRTTDAQVDITFSGTASADGTFSLVGETRNGAGGTPVPFTMPPVSFNQGDTAASIIGTDSANIISAWDDAQQDAAGVNISVIKTPIGSSNIWVVVNQDSPNQDMEFIAGSLKIVWT